jgi:hypothetical protein
MRDGTIASSLKGYGRSVIRNLDGFHLWPYKYFSKDANQAYALLQYSYNNKTLVF